MIYKSYLIENNINNIDKNLILFYGENLGLKNEFKKQIRSNKKKAEIIIFLQDDILKDENGFYNEIMNISLFEQKKIYFIENVNDKILQIIQKIEDNINDQKIFLFGDLLDKRSKIRSYFEKSDHAGAVACYADNEISIRKIILNKLKDFKGLSTQNVNIILENCYLDRVRLNNELSKIFTYFTDKELKYEKLEILLDVKTNDNFNSLKDEALNGNKVQTNKLLSDTQIDSEKNIFYLNLINMRLNKLADAFELSKQTNLENAINMLRPPIFWKDKPAVLKQARKWNSNKIKNILNKTYNLEIDIKTNSNINKNILIKKLLIDICDLANAS